MENKVKTTKKEQKRLTPEQRGKIGTLSSVIGILVNLLLFAGKFFAGMLIGSIAISADALNNLSDAASSLISLVTFRIASKPADRDHPFGHARIEYVSALIVGFLIIIVGYELIKSSIEKIISPTETTYQSVVVWILAISIALKLFLFVLNRLFGKRIMSDVLLATSLDSFTDAMATMAVLVSTLLLRFAQLNIDAYMGLIVAMLILWAGIKVLRENLSPILGEAPSQKVIEQITCIIVRYPEILGIHDMAVHSYGPMHIIVSLHAEVDGRVDVFTTHDVIDNIERQIKEELDIDCTIHMDPIVVGDEMVDKLKKTVHDILKSIDLRIHLHDFRCVIGRSHTNLIFDADVPFEIKEKDEVLRKMMSDAIKSKLGDQYFAVITIDRN